MALGKARMPRDDGQQPIPIMAGDGVRKVAFTGTSAAVALPTLASGANPRVVSLRADTGSCLVVFGASDVTAADFSANVAAGALIVADDGWLDVPVNPAGSDGQEKTHLAVITATWPSSATNGTLAIMARS